MRIAQVAPLMESVPPRLYGGTERVVSYLTEELVKRGHDVTLFASGDSVTRARLHSIVDQSLRLSPDSVNPFVYHLLQVEEVFKHSREFDVIHFHIDTLPFSLMRRSKIPSVTTLHGRLDLPELSLLFQEFRDLPMVSISNDQRRPQGEANWQATVYNGMPAELYTYCPDPGSYLVFLGRISPEKRVDRAIEIARQAGMPLRIAAKVDPVDQDYFDQQIKPLLDDPLVEFIGEVGEEAKNELLGNAYALLLPIDWPEPFGLVMAEAMACGTPVIAWRRGSVPEVVDHGGTGFIVENTREAAAAVEKIGTISRRHCRQVFERRFSAGRMAQDYLSVYEAMVNPENELRMAG